MLDMYIVHCTVLYSIDLTSKIIFKFQEEGRVYQVGRRLVLMTKNADGIPTHFVCRKFSTENLSTVCCIFAKVPSLKTEFPEKWWRSYEVLFRFR